MKRVQLFEFEDQAWFPNSMRIAITRLLVVLHKMMGMGYVLSDLISAALKKSGDDQIVDLGSGSGGSMPQVIEILNDSDDHANVKMIMTDLYPNTNTISDIKKLNNKNLTYSETSVNATKLGDAPKGLKTMINSFHHTNPTQAREVLESAYTNKQAILIYEMAENKIPLIIWWLFLPLSIVIMYLMVWLMTPFVKPLTFKQLFFTYIIPVIPFFYAWDGQASMPRIYAMKDIDELLEGLDKNYSWTKEPAKKPNGRTLGYYVLGVPNKSTV